MFSRAAVFAVALALLLCLTAHAQETILPLPLEQISPTEAVARAKKEHRVLIVVHKWKRPPRDRRPWWASDTVRAWLKWHAILIELDPGDPNTKEFLSKYPSTISRQFWGFDVIIDGRQVEEMGLPASGIPNAKNSDDWADSWGPGITAVFTLFQLDFMMERRQATHAIWSAAHERNCPAPTQPAREFLYNQTRDGLPAVDDLTAPAAGDRYVDVMARLKEADALAAAGDRARAVSLLSWLWERGGQADPGFSLARVGLVLPRLVAIKQHEKAAGARMLDLSSAELALYPWYDDSDELAYLSLRYCNGETMMVVTRLITETIDTDEQTMGGVITDRLGNLKARLAEHTRDPMISAADWRKIVKIARTRTPLGSPADIKARWFRQRVETLTVGAVRTYATLLSSEDPFERERAAALAQDVLMLAAEAPPAVRAATLRAFVFAAASVGRAGPEHAAWLSQAAALEQTADVAAKPAAEQQPRPTGGDPLMRHIGTRQK